MQNFFSNEQAFMKNHALAIALAVCSVWSGTCAADVGLLGVGIISGSSAGSGKDLSRQAGRLENGLSNDLLAGAGSGLDYAGGEEFIALPDRGPNATPYLPSVDNTSSYIPRVQTLIIKVAPAPKGSDLPLSVEPQLTQTTLLSSRAPLAYGNGKAFGLGSGEPKINRAGRNYFVGRSDNYASGLPSSDPSHARFDPEGLRASKDRGSLFISDEYGPALYEFDRSTGERLRSYKLPAKFAAHALAPTGDAEIAANSVGRTANKGMEGLAITPDGKTLVGIMQAALRQDALVPETRNLTRIVAVDIERGTVREYGYMLNEGAGVSEILAINAHEFLVLERDSGGRGEHKPAVLKKLYRIDLERAADISTLAGAQAAEAAAEKVEVVDLVKLFSENGIAAQDVPAKLEGMTFGPDVEIDGKRQHTLYLANDNDFLPEVAGASRIFVLGFTDADIPGLAPQR